MTISRGPRGFFCLQDVRRGPVNVDVIPLKHCPVLMADFELNLERLKSHSHPCSCAAEYLICVAISYRAERICFRRRGREIIPTASTEGSEFEIEPFESFLAGRWMNHYRQLCGFKYPCKAGSFTVMVGGENAELGFEITKPGSEPFATLSIIKSTISAKTCAKIVADFCDSRRPTSVGIYNRLRSWWVAVTKTTTA